MLLWSNDLNYLHKFSIEQIFDSLLILPDEQSGIALSRAM